MAEGDGLAKLTLFLNQTKRQAEMAIDCLNTKIQELEERNEETNKKAEKYMDERDYFKNYAEQLQLENSKKWRLQERDDWKALVDSVQRDRARLQDECTRMEKELADAFSEIENLRAAALTSAVAVGPAIDESPPSRGDESSGVFSLSPISPSKTKPQSPSSFLAVDDTGDQTGACERITMNGYDKTIGISGEESVVNTLCPISMTAMESISGSSYISEASHVMSIDIPSTPSTPPFSPSERNIHNAMSGDSNMSSHAGHSNSSEDDSLASTPAITPYHTAVTANGCRRLESSCTKPTSTAGAAHSPTTATRAATALMAAEEAASGTAVRETELSSDHSNAPESISPANTVRDLRLELADVIAELEITKRSADAGKYELEEEISHLQEELAEWTTKLATCPSCGFDLAGYLVSIQSMGSGKNRSNETGRAGIDVLTVGVAPIQSKGGSRVVTMPSSHAAVVSKSTWSPFSIFGYFFSSSSSYSGVESTAIQRV